MRCTSLASRRRTTRPCCACSIRPGRRVCPPQPALRIKQVGVSLHGLIASHRLQLDLFDQPATDAAARARAENLSRTLDRINQRFGRDSIQVGLLAGDRTDYTGSKIAFTRIPDLEEFLE